jgi:hypothetical protein
MPWGWFVFSTASSRDIEPIKNDPGAVRELVERVVTNAGATLQDVYFEVGSDRAHAIVQGLDDYYKSKAVGRILGASSYTKLLTAEQAGAALELEDELRGSTGS